MSAYKYNRLIHVHVRTTIIVIAGKYLRLKIIVLFVSNTCRRNYSLTFVPDTAVWFDPGNPEATVFFILALSHLALSAWMVLEYYVVNWPHFVVHGVLGAIVPKFISSAM